MVLSVGGFFAYFARNARCAVTTDLMCDIPTQKTTSPPERPFSDYINKASPRGRNVNYDEKLLTEKKKLSCSFYLYKFRNYVSYGFPVKHFCNPGVHYETPCISVCVCVCVCMYIYIYIYIYKYIIYTGCNRRNGPDFGRVFLMLNYTENPQNTYIQS